jgi:hypothetical protein
VQEKEEEGEETVSESYDKEIDAIGTLLKALGPLDAKARKAVIAYVEKRLEITLLDDGESSHHDATSNPTPPGETPTTEGPGKDECHITELVAQKQPRSAVEMAVLVAYYLSHKAPQEERKQTISTEDLTTYFKIANFKLPKAPQYTLPNTKNAGYLESAGSGEYKLNPVGYNLIVHSLPKTKSATTRTRPPKMKARKGKLKTGHKKSKARG